VKYRLLFIATTLAKISIFVYFSLFPTIFFGGGNDSEYYDTYAQGQDSEIPNIWPVILRFLNDQGMYSREGVSYFLAFLGVIIIPLLAANLSIYKDSPARKRIFWGVAAAIAIYPTLFFYTFDIYRDVFMVLIFLLGLLTVRAFIKSKNFSVKIWYVLLIIGISFFLYLFRPYLGFGFFISFIGFNYFNFRKISLSFCLILFFCTLNILFLIGLLDPIFSYRGSFDDMDGGSNIGIRFDSFALFIPDFFKSFIFQMFGLYFPNAVAIGVFLIESFPFIIVFTYLIRNRKYSTPFINYLVVFFISYSTIWLMGNDNLGTAVRLRIYSYISVFIAGAIIYQKKMAALLLERNMLASENEKRSALDK
jgi:hypothetical protein